MKWIIHAGNPLVTTQGINDIFRSDPRKDDSVLVTPHIDSALPLVSEAMAGDWNDSALAGMMGPRSVLTMQLPTCPIKSSVARFLRRIQADHRPMLAVACRITTFSKSEMSVSTALTERLAQGAGLGDPIVNSTTAATSGDPSSTSTQFDNFLELNYGARKIAPPDVEVRSVGEYSRLVDQLFKSQSFREATDNISLMVVISARDMACPPGSQMVAEHIYYHIADKHLEDFSRVVLPTARDQGIRLAAGFVSLHSSAQVLQYGDVAQRAWDLIYPTRQWSPLRQGGPRNPNYGGGTGGGGGVEYADTGRGYSGRQVYFEDDRGQMVHGDGMFVSPNTKHHRGILADELQLLEERKFMLQKEIARQRAGLPYGASSTAVDDEAHDRGMGPSRSASRPDAEHSPSRLIEASRRDLVELGKQHDELERKFQAMAQKLSEEKEALKNTEAKIVKNEHRLLEERPRKEVLTEEKTRLAAQASALSIDRDRLFRELHAKEELSLDRERKLQDSETAFLVAKNEQMQREEEGINKAREQVREALDNSRKSIENASTELNLDQERKLRVLEERRKNAQIKVDDEVARRDEASNKAVALKTKFMGLQQETAQLERQLHSVNLREQELRNRTNPPALLSHDAQLKLQLQQTALEGTFTGLQQERQAAKQVIQEMEAQALRQEQGITEAEAKAKDTYTSLFSRYRHQIDTMARTLVEHETARRNVIEQEALLAWDQLSLDEVVNWDKALYSGERYFHDGTHTELRQEMMRINKETTDTLHRVTALVQQAEDYKLKFTICDQGHAELMADGRRQLLDLQEEDAALRDSIGKDGGVLAKLTDEQRQLEARCETLRACLAQAPIDQSRNRSGGIVAIKHSNVLPSAGELIDRLTQLYTNAEGKLDVHQLETIANQRKIERLEREVEERTNILKRVRSSVAETETDIQKLEDTVAERKLAVDERSNNHAVLKQQLKDEYVRTQETIARHRVESGQELQALTQQEEQLQEVLHRTERELVQLRKQREELRRVNTEPNEASLRLEVQRELVKQKQIRAEIQALSEYVPTPGGGSYPAALSASNTGSGAGREIFGTDPSSRMAANVFDGSTTAAPAAAAQPSTPAAGTSDGEGRSTPVATRSKTPTFEQL